MLIEAEFDRSEIELLKECVMATFITLESPPLQIASELADGPPKALASSTDNPFTVRLKLSEQDIGTLDSCIYLVLCLLSIRPT